MRTSAQILLVVTLVLFCTVSTYAQEALWKELDRKSTMLYRQGRHSEAVQVTEEALTVAEKTFGPDHPAVATSLNNLATLYQLQGKYSDAEPLFKRALKIREKVLKPDHPDVATSLNNLARLYQAQGRYAEAEPLFKRSLEIYEKALGPDHPWMATVCENMAELYKTIGKEDEAERLEARAKKIRKGENKTDQTSGWSVNTYGFAVYIRGHELLSGLTTGFISCIVLLVICSGLFKFLSRTTKHPMRFAIWGIPIIAAIIYFLPLIYMNFALGGSLKNLPYLIYVLQICILCALFEPLEMIGRSKWAVLWLIVPIYNMVVSWKWANEALHRPGKEKATK